MSERDTKLTQTEERMYALLATGKPVRRDELKLLTNDGELCSDANVRCHISSIRRKIEVTDPSIAIMAVCNGAGPNKGWTYHLVRRMSNPYDGVK